MRGSFYSRVLCVGLWSLWVLTSGVYAWPFQSQKKQPKQIPQFSASLYTVGSPAKWNMFSSGRCQNLALAMKERTLSSITFVFEHYAFKLEGHKVSEIPASDVDISALENCFSEVLQSGLDVHLKIQLPDATTPAYPEFVWRSEFEFDLEEYSKQLVEPYLGALAHVLKSYPDRKATVFLLHEAHRMVCEHTGEVVDFYHHVRDWLGADNQNIRLAISLDWSFFKNSESDSPYAYCIKHKAAVGAFLRDPVLESIGIGAYAPGGGWNGVVGSVSEGENDMKKFFQRVESTLNAYQVPRSKPVGISEWNGGGREPNTWGNPKVKPYQNSFRGSLRYLINASLRNPLDRFTFWNLRSSDQEWIGAIDLLKEPLLHLAAQSREIERHHWRVE